MKNKLLKCISLILCVFFSLSLLACNDESETPPPEKPPQTNFYEEILYIKNPKFYCYEQFDNVEDASAYAKTWREDYEIYIPDIEDADNLRIDFLTFRSADEKEKFSHKIEFAYTNAEPFYKLRGETTVYEKGQLDKTEFYIETGELIVGPKEKTNINYFYKEDGKISSTYDLASYKGAPIAIKQNNFVLLHLSISIQEMETKTPEEIKALVLDNIVPIEEQKYKDKEILTDYYLGIEVPITGPLYTHIIHDNFGDNKLINRYLNKYFDVFSFAIQLDGFNNSTYATETEFYPWHYYLPSYSSLYDFELLQTNDKTVDIKLNAVSIPNSLLYEDDNKTYEYSLVISKELENGYRIIIKNGYGNICNGTITAEDKTDINLEEIEQKITKNIVLIKGGKK